MTDRNTAQLVVDLRATDEAVRSNNWVAPGLGVPGAPLGLLSAPLNPLAGLAAAGLGWFMPLVSFLGEGLTQLQGGNGASVTSGSQDFGAAGRDIGGVASAYQASAGAETTGWSGPAASDYRNTATQYADGVAGLGQGSNTVGSAIIGAGQVVAQAIAEVTELIAQAVAEIVPIMTQAMAREGTNPGSTAQAIPPCVGIAAAYAAQIAAKLAALVASGNNLMKLVQGGLAVVDLIKQALSSISQQSTRPDAEPRLSAAADQPSGGGSAGGKEEADLGNSEASAASSPSSARAGGLGGGSPTSGMATSGMSMPGMSAPTGSAVPPGVAAQSIGAIPPLPGTVPEASRYPGHGATGVPAGTAPGGPAPVGAAAPGLAAGARTAAGRGTDLARPDRRSPSPAAPVPGGTPMGGMPGARAAGEKDKEHQRKYSVVERHDEEFKVAPAVISPKKPKN